MIKFGLRQYDRASVVRGIAITVMLCVVGYFVATGYVLFYKEQPVDVTHGPKHRTMSELLAATEKQSDDKQAEPTSAASVETLPIKVDGGSYGIAAGGGLVHMSSTELDVYFSQAQDLGVGWVRWDMDWAVLQPDGPGEAKWSDVEKVLDAAQDVGIKLLPVVTHTPAWARQAECVESEACAPANAADFAHFVAEAAARYKDRGLDHFEIWNEPNYQKSWQPAPSIEQYGQLLQATYSAVKHANPNAMVLAGGLAAAEDKDGQIAPLTFVRGLYDQGVRDFDAVALHPYSYPALPSYDAWWNGWQQMSTVRDVMANGGDAKKQVWITEFGAPTGGDGAMHGTDELEEYIYGHDFMSEAAQDSLLREAIRLHADNAGWAGPFFWYSLQDTASNPASPDSFFGLLRPDASQKPAYQTFQTILRKS